MSPFDASRNGLSDAIASYCLAHKQPVIRPPTNCTLVELGPKSSVAACGFSRKINAYQLCDYGAEMHPFLGGTLGSFAVLRDIEARNLPDTSLINIIQYRRVLLLTRQGDPAPNYPDMRLLSRQAAWNLLLDENYADLTTAGLYSKPQRIKSVLRQYDKCHAVADLLHFLAGAIRIGVIESAEVNPLLADRSLIPGGIEFGLSPVAVYSTVVAKLEAACLAFLESHRPFDTSPYQLRALNYCSERLGSYLLKKELAKTFGLRVPRQIYGHMHVVSEDEVYVRGD